MSLCAPRGYIYEGRQYGKDPERDCLIVDHQGNPMPNQPLPPQPGYELEVDRPTLLERVLGL